MFRVCVLFAVFCYVFGSKSETWPFELADKYMEEFKSNVDELRNLATSYQQQEESGESLTLQKNSLTEAIEDPIQYDFIIVGGGTSGSVLANRLSEVPEWKVLLLEAGGVETKATKVPKNWELLRNTYYNWGFRTTPQNYSCLAMTDHKCTIPSGRALGGTSTMNSMVYTRGNQLDYDIWADLDNKGWCWSDVLPYFKKIENAHFEPFDKKYHHQGGYQHIQHPQHLSHLTDNILEAAKEMGLHIVDYNGKYQMGASVPQLNTDCGQRLSAASAYLECAEKRKNLVIRPLAQVLKILISTHTKEAKGVQYLHDGKVFVAKAKKEVILTAGAINSAKILLLSGVGPKDECDKHSIDLVKDLQVGHNLNVRPTFIGLDYFYKEPKLHSTEYEQNFKYLKAGKGPLTSPGVEGLLFLKTNVSKSHTNYPDIEVQVVSKSHPKIENYHWMKMSKVHYDSIWKPLEGKDYVKMLITLNHPESKGILKLHTPNPLDYPIIEPHFLTDEDETDYHTLLSGIYEAIKLSHTKAFAKSGLVINHNPIHGCDGTEFGTEAYWECAIKYLVVPSEDVSGTARMGPVTDNEAVVDNKLRVHGVHKLRVADASVIPVSITGNLMGPSMMIGEKAAHMIIEEWTDH